MSETTPDKVRLRKRSTGNLRANYRKWRNRNPIRLWRKRHRCSLDMLAATLGLSLMAVYKWESGSVFPSPPSLNKLFALTDITATELAEWKRSVP